MSYDVYWVKNRAEKIADFEHPTLQGVATYGYLSPQGASSLALGYVIVGLSGRLGCALSDSFWAM